MKLTPQEIESITPVIEKYLVVNNFTLFQFIDELYNLMQQATQIESESVSKKLAQSYAKNLPPHAL